jgi:hypothetical protein
VVEVEDNGGRRPSVRERTGGAAASGVPVAGAALPPSVSFIGKRAPSLNARKPQEKSAWRFLNFPYGAGLSVS